MSFTLSVMLKVVLDTMKFNHCSRIDPWVADLSPALKILLNEEIFIHITIFIHAYSLHKNAKNC